jgi:phosphatidate phosphatase APP1
MKIHDTAESAIIVKFLVPGFAKIIRYLRKAKEVKIFFVSSSP